MGAFLVVVESKDYIKTPKDWGRMGLQWLIFYDIRKTDLDAIDMNRGSSEILLRCL